MHVQSARGNHSTDVGGVPNNSNSLAGSRSLKSLDSSSAAASATSSGKAISIPFPLTNRATADLAGITGRHGAGDGTTTTKHYKNAVGAVEPRATPQSITH